MTDIIMLAMFCSTIIAVSLIIARYHRQQSELSHREREAIRAHELSKRQLELMYQNEPSELPDADEFPPLRRRLVDAVQRRNW